MAVAAPPWRAAPLPRKLATTRTAGDSCGRHCRRPGKAAFTAAAGRCRGGFGSSAPSARYGPCAERER